MQIYQRLDFEMRNIQENLDLKDLYLYQNDYSFLNLFLIDRKAQNLSTGTIQFYEQKLSKFFNFCKSLHVDQVAEIDSNLIKQFFIYLNSNGHTAGGIHCYFRAIKAFLRWYENEYEPEGWKNPIAFVKAPKVPIDPLEPVNIKDVESLMETCPRGNVIGCRDKALLLFLLDTGVRASELLSLNLEDINLLSGEVLIRQGKGRKPRNVFFGSRTRKAIKAYLNKRNDDSPALWITRDHCRLSYWGLKAMIRRRANRARVDPPSIHSFRRWFALTCLRGGANVYSIQELMGHADLQVMKRYLRQTNLDLKKDFLKVNPVDRL